MCIILHLAHDCTVVQHQPRGVGTQELPLLPHEKQYLPDIKANIAELRVEHQRSWEEEHPGEDPGKVGPGCAMGSPALPARHVVQRGGAEAHWKHLHPQAPALPMPPFLYEPPAEVSLQQLRVPAPHAHM